MWMRKANKDYFYRSYRKDGKVHKEYLGDATSEASQNFIRELEHKKTVGKERRHRNKEIDSLKNMIDEVNRVTDTLLRLLFIENGYFKRKSEIRRIKYAE